MNQFHRWICQSGYWKRKLEQRVLPWVLGDLELGGNLLEVGPGPGLTTDLLRLRVGRLTAVEIDSHLAESLASRLHGTNVEVVRGDATALPFQDGSFSGAVSFTMLHHVPSAELQDRLLREVCRVIYPGAVFAGVDSLSNLRMRLLHIWDTLVPVDPSTLGARLEAAGFTRISIAVDGRTSDLARSGYERLYRVSEKTYKA
ncbi:MAG: class I SAM-dependent methyltransferase [Terriglobia bacterium]